MNYLVILNTQAGELEKILSGVKTMILKEFDPATEPPVHPGDSLYFLRDKDGCAVRVKAAVIRVLPFMNSLDNDLSHILKERQPRLQLTEDQFNTWSTRQQVLLVEFNDAQKIPVIHVELEKIADRSDWIPFEEFSLIA